MRLPVVRGFITSTGAARVLGVSTKTVRRLIAQGWLRATMENGRYRLYREAVALLRRWGPPLMAPGRAAKVVRRDPSTVRRWLNQCRLPHVLVDGRRLVRRGDLAAFVTREIADKPRARTRRTPVVNPRTRSPAWRRT